MALPSLAPWQAFLAGLSLGLFTTLLYTRVSVGYWNFLRAPRNACKYMYWIAGLAAGYIVYYMTYVVLVLEESPLWLSLLVSLSGLAAFYLAYYLTRDRVDWSICYKNEG